MKRTKTDAEVTQEIPAAELERLRELVRADIRKDTRRVYMRNLRDFRRWAQRLLGFGEVIK